mmetsp:Transcript_15167/g.23818  ORF Transcript_15167/g.23818 Transcript_15167/m.23818 type:complete len:136 (-) Transcript_15167:190-597(-)|eukprot:CAMPEP_0117026540 /NCGR_PEP_ID=MMETSP0472-20121206/19499_1 /TAXON_ID=693140 ORGANISM="Tiarina fusus, Strain LIS" /NCGR_SAMPLE_ID=MMETSP0472 /ASSEMBLY_ACC=CAM_ASM_000603 /LENGTH=135 /DNA_ID=CAMNT_0004733569 /DNA_START=42 /DNA_END=449 /DNA_ORIENTATION=-
MAETKEETLKEFTAEEVFKHTSQEDCWLVIGNESNGGPKVYDVTKYLDDHPGGAEVMLDVAGQNADEFFEDIGHSKEARDELKKHLIGTFKLDEATIAKMRADAEKKAAQGSQNSMMMVAVVALIAIYVAYTQMA